MKFLIANCSILGIEGRVDGDIECGIERFTHALVIPTEVVECAVMRYPNKPGSQGRKLLECGEFVVRTRESVLNDVFAIHDRAHHARAITMQARSYVLYERQEPLARCAQIRQGCLIFTHCSTPVLYDNEHTRNK